MSATSPDLINQWKEKKDLWPIPKITGDRNQANLTRDLEKYCQMALKLGADAARVVGASIIQVEEAAVSIAVYRLTVSYDWETYPNDSDANPGDIPVANLAHLGLIR